MWTVYNSILHGSNRPAIEINKSVFEKTCNNSKKRKVVFLDFEKKTLKTYV